MAARKHDDDTIIAALTGRTVTAAAEILGLHPRRVAAHKARLAKVGIAPEHGLTVQAPEAFAMGKVTVQRNEKGEVTNTMCLEQHRTMAAPDSHASRGGWMSGRDAQVITYHSEHGEVGRITVSADMLRGEAA